MCIRLVVSLLPTILFFVFYTAQGAERGIKLTQTYQPSQGKQVALLIGNANYNNSPLKNPTNDASDMAEVLRQKGFDVTLLLNADLQQMKEAIINFGDKLNYSDVGLFYFAGHGLQFKGNNYLVPIHNEIKQEADIEFEALNANRVLANMDQANNRVNIVILDACRNNPYSKSYRSAGSGLAKLDAPTGSIIAYATAPNSVAYDGDGKNGLYTKHLIQNINKDGLAIESIFKQVRIAVLRETNNQQVPWESSSLTGDYYFSASKQVQKLGGLPSGQVQFVEHVLETKISANSLGVSGNYLALGEGEDGYTHLFNLSKMKFENKKLPYYRYKKNKKMWKSYSMDQSVCGDNGCNVQLRHLGESEHKVIIPKSFGEITTYSFTDMGNLIFGTDLGWVLLYTRDGNKMAEYKNGNGLVKQIAVQKNTISVILDDGTIMVLKNIENSQKLPELITLKL